MMTKELMKRSTGEYLGRVTVSIGVATMHKSDTIQNLIEPFAFGSRLRLHPFAVLITVTSATVLFGVLGAILAAPLTSAAVNAYHQLRDAGLLGSDPTPQTDTTAESPDDWTRASPKED